MCRIEKANLEDLDEIPRPMECRFITRWDLQTRIKNRQ